jgi:hypothetical protein
LPWFDLRGGRGSRIEIVKQIGASLKRIRAIGHEAIRTKG